MRGLRSASHRSVARQQFKALVGRLLRQLPPVVGRRVRWWRHGRVRLGSMRRLTPFSSVFGFDRGLPLDRWYVEHFLARFAAQPGYGRGAIQGRVLEIGGREYVDRFGIASDEPATGRVHRVDVLHVDSTNPDATIVGSLTDEGLLPSAAFDCVICTQTLHVIYDTRAALRSMHRALRVEGTLLLTVPGITRSCVPDRDAWGDWWRFTVRSLRRLLDEIFDPREVQVEAYGNVLAAAGFLYGLAVEDLRPAEIEMHDPDFEVIVAARAVKARERP
jgi:SAM-dependent methyltransferase